MKTIYEIAEQFSSEGPSVINNYYTELDEIRGIRQSEAGSYLDRLTDEQRMGLLRDQKMEKATESYEHAFARYEGQVEYHESQLEKRGNYITGELFKVEDAGALARAATASDAELGAMLELAAQAQNAELGRAVFVAAEQRGLGNLMKDYFDKLNPEGRELYEEYLAIPSPEILERRRDIESILPAPNPDELMPRATVY
jgi:hypothetical protein